MATTAAMAIRDSEARARLNRALNRLATRLGVEESAAAPDAIPVRDPAMKAIREVERLADRIEALDAALKDEGYSAAAGSAGKVEPAAQTADDAVPYEVRKAREEAAAIKAEDAASVAAEEPADESTTAPSRATKGKGRS